CRRRHRRAFHELDGLPLRVEKTQHFLVDDRVAFAGFGDETLALLGRLVQRLFKQLVNLFPELGVHQLLLRLSSRYSHALALFHSRITVIGATFITSAVSSTLSPPKKRSSTIRLFRSSISARLFNASSSANRSGSLPMGSVIASSSESCWTSVFLSARGRWRAKSTRMRRIICAATPKKCARFCQRTAFQSIRRM